MFSNHTPRGNPTPGGAPTRTPTPANGEQAPPAHDESVCGLSHLGQTGTEVLYCPRCSYDRDRGPYPPQERPPSPEDLEVARFLRLLAERPAAVAALARILATALREVA